MNTEKLLHPVHPGEVLLEEFLKPLGISQRAFARAIHVPANRVNDIVLGRRSVTGDTALRFSKALGTTPDFWIGLQADYELDMARIEAQNKDHEEIQPVIQE